MANREPKVLDNKVLRKVLLRYVMSRQTCFNYETMQSGPWVWSMLPAMQELYSDDEIAEKNKDYFKFFNCHPWFGQLMMGPQLLAYFYQIYMWGKIYHVELEL